MGLVLPVVGTTPGPLYASEQNAAMTVIDAHNHTSGNGVQVPTAGLNINADLNFNSNNATSVAAVEHVALSSDPSVNKSTYFKGNELYVKDGAGNVVQMTSGGAIPFSSSGITYTAPWTGAVSVSTATIYSQNTEAVTFGLIVGGYTSDDNAVANTIALQRAINYLRSLTNGGWLVLPQGTIQMVDLDVTGVGVGAPTTVAFGIRGSGDRGTILQQINNSIAWATSHAYVVGNLKSANGNIYKCTTAGTSASSGTGPSGTGAAISDGTCVWAYQIAGYGSPNMIDLTGSSSVTLENFSLFTGNRTACGILNARSTTSPAKRNRFKELYVFGGCSKALVAHIAAEDASYVRCHFANQGSFGDSCAFFGSRNTLSASSSYGSIATSSTTSESNFVSDCKFASSNSGGYIIHCSEDYGITFDACASYASGISYPSGLLAHFYFDAPVVTTNELWFTCRNHVFEGDGDCFYFYTGGSTKTFVNFTMVDNRTMTSASHQQWMNHDANYDVFERLFFRNNKGIDISGGTEAAITLYVAEYSIIEHFNLGAVINVNGYIGGSSVKTNRAGWNAASEHGCKVEFIESYSSGAGASYTRFGHGAVQPDPHLARFYPGTADTVSGLHLAGMLYMVDGATYDPLNTKRTTPYLCFWDGTAWKAVGDGIRIAGNASWTPGAVSNGAYVTKSVTVTGARYGDTVSVGYSTTLANGLIICGAVTANDTVTVTIYNMSGGTLTPSAGTVYANAFKPN
jgi:hypothetical protein